MSFLLDVNVLIALLDQDHLFHNSAVDWFESVAPAGWATCAHTENGVLRILGSSRYPAGPSTPAAAAPMLASLLAYEGHEFWSDSISLLSSSLIDIAAVANAAHVTDTYLLALAASRGGILATFDRRLSADAVKEGATSLHVIA